MYCPNCGDWVQSQVGDCAACHACFETGAAWNPAEHPPPHLTSQTRWESLSTARRLAFSGRVLLLFLLLGPAIAAMASFGMRGVASKFSALVFPFYSVGGVIALCTWIIFSASLRLLAIFESRLQIKHLPFACIATFSLLAGGLSGFLVVSGPICFAHASQGMAGALGSCLQQAAWSGYPVSLLPGAVCGLLSVLLWHNSRSTPSR